TGLALQSEAIAVALEDFFHKGGATESSAVDEITHPSVDDLPQRQPATPLHLALYFAGRETPARRRVRRALRLCFVRQLAGFSLIVEPEPVGGCGGFPIFLEVFSTDMRRV